MSQDVISLVIDSFWKILLPGLTVTIPLTAVSFALAMVISIAVALIQYRGTPILTPITRFYIWVIRGTPLLVQLFVVFYGLPHAGILINPWTAAIIVFSINEGAYCAETVRAALESVPAGQLEAGLSTGMSWLQVVRRIILPQAMRTAFPTLGNSLIAMVKDTSLAANITVTEMFMTTQRIVARTYEPLVLYIEVGLIYLLFCTVLTRIQRAGEEKLRFYGRR
ncbi:amino acid ABC transporter permease [Sutterella seckii]|uniref:Amino acid ABC transporter permease n=1 Tax=Sutterella seckii TaxID=1944635 RepID=A0A6I1EJR6_9BURK|nr:amino acid ABC transporter permease [Sutterella seckii]KAB7660718.1 amino acid ABC transporter permease [Sutterella seckii]